MVTKVRSNTEKKRESAIDALDYVLDSKFLSALAEPSRIQVLKQVIRLGKADISELSQGLSLDRSVISRHLSILEEVGILVREKHGKHVFYYLDPSGAIKRFQLILERIEEVVALCCPPPA
ncbi:ArsR/SmtB family transcription factor [Leptospira sp. WS4.C2]